MAKSTIPKPIRTCQVEGCEKKAIARNYCGKHYQRIWKKGLSPLPPKYDKLCKVYRCEAEQYTRGYCNRHYRQIKEYGHIIGDPKFTKFMLNEINIKDDICEIVLRNYRNIPIGVAIIDVEDYPKVSKEKWHLSDGYVKDTNHRPLHGIILNIPNKKNIEIDHINHDGLDNRKSNLRICTHQQNTFNKKLCSTNTSGYKGVTFHKGHGKWTAKIGVNGERKYLGCFDNKYDAAVAYDKKAIELFGEFAATNKELGLK